MSKEFLYHSVNKFIEDLSKQNLLDKGKISDGFHTFHELYEFRMALTACLFNEWSANDIHYTYKSLRHSDGKLCFGGDWFIVVALIEGNQVSFHYEKRYWNHFNIREFEVSRLIYDGHTSEDSLNTLSKKAIKHFKDREENGLETAIAESRYTSAFASLSPGFKVNKKPAKALKVSSMFIQKTAKEIKPEDIIFINNKVFLVIDKSGPDVNLYVKNIDTGESDKLLFDKELDVLVHKVF